MSGKLNRQLDPTQTGSDAARLRADLHKRVVGQDDAIEDVVNIYQTFLAGLSSPGRPIGNFLFLGPTGTGKTRMVEAAAESVDAELFKRRFAELLEFVRSGELPIVTVPPPALLPAHDDKAAESDTRVMAMLFADAVNYSKLTEEQVPRFVQHFLGAIADLMRRQQTGAVTRNTWGDGLYLVFKELQDAGVSLEVKHRQVFDANGHKRQPVRFQPRTKERSNQIAQLNRMMAL